MTLEGTNTFVVGEEGGEEAAYVIDPGPADEGHIAAVREEAERRGGIEGVLLTHSHLDHSEGVEMLGAPALSGEPGSPRVRNAIRLCEDWSVTSTSPATRRRRYSLWRSAWSCRPNSLCW